MINIQGRNKIKILGIAFLSVILLLGLVALPRTETCESLIGTSNLNSNETIVITSPDGYYATFNAGYYRATFGFENDDNGADPEGWTLSEGTGTSCEVYDNAAWSHRKVLKLYDNSASNYVIAIQLFGANKYEETVEFYFRASDPTWSTIMVLDDLGYNMKVAIATAGDYLYYLSENDQWTATDKAISADTWYRIRIDFDMSNWDQPPPYQDYTTLAYNVYVDGVLEIQFSDWKYGTYAIGRFWTATADTSTGYTTYFDAIGYEWDDDYDVGDNQEQGLLLDIQQDLTGATYSIDSGTFYSTLGDMVIPFESGEHTVVVSAPGYDSGSSDYECG